jgi:hypothetical protein
MSHDGRPLTKQDLLWSLPEDVASELPDAIA